MFPTLVWPLSGALAPPEIDAPSQAALVQQLAAHLFRVPVEELKSTTRRRASAALARQVAMYVCHASLGISFSDVGQFFGRDRTTAAHACRVVEDRRDDKEFDELIGRMETAIAALGLCRQSYIFPLPFIERSDHA